MAANDHLCNAPSPLPSALWVFSYWLLPVPYEGTAMFVSPDTDDESWGPERVCDLAGITEFVRGDGGSGKQVGLILRPGLQPLSSHWNAGGAIKSVIYLIVYEKAFCKTIKYSSIIYTVIVVIKKQ